MTQASAPLLAATPTARAGPCPRTTREPDRAATEQPQGLRLWGLVPARLAPHPPLPTPLEAEIMTQAAAPLLAATPNFSSGSRARSTALTHNCRLVWLESWRGSRYVACRRKLGVVVVVVYVRACHFRVPVVWVCDCACLWRSVRWPRCMLHFGSAMGCACPCSCHPGSSSACLFIKYTKKWKHLAWQF